MNLHRHEIKDRQTRERERDQTDSQSDTAVHWRESKRDRMDDCPPQEEKSSSGGTTMTMGFTMIGFQ